MKTVQTENQVRNLLQSQWSEPTPAPATVQANNAVPARVPETTAQQQLQKALSKYAKTPPATEQQIKGFVKHMAINFNKRDNYFWQMITMQLLKDEPTYQHLKDMFNYFTRAYPWNDITAAQILNYSTAIKTYNAEEVSLQMDRHPDTEYAAIYLPHEDKYIYATLDDAEKTNVEFTPIESLNKRRQYEA